MPKLYEISQDLKKLESLIEEGGDDEALKEALAEALNENQANFADKANNILAILKNWDGEAGMIKTEETRLADRRRALEAKGKNLKGYLLAHMARSNQTKIKAPLGTISIRKGRESVVVTDEYELPQGYFTTVSSVQADKKALTKLWNDTPEDERAALPGFRIERGNDGLTIR